MALTATTSTQLYQFFVVAFGAAPGVTYMNQLAAASDSGMTVKDIVNVFTQKPQFTSVYPTFLTNAAFAAKIVENVGEINCGIFTFATPFASVKFQAEKLSPISLCPGING